MPVYLAEIFLDAADGIHSGTWRDRYFRWIYRVSSPQQWLVSWQTQEPVYRGNPCHTSGWILFAAL